MVAVVVSAVHAATVFLVCVHSLIFVFASPAVAVVDC